jgi:Flp pilus assembly pilin Flp
MKIRAQNIVEYTMLVLAISAAATVMIKYVQNAINARFVEIRREMNESQR